MSEHLRGWRAALFTFFFVPGVALASWVTRTPEIRTQIDASLSQMGLVLLGLSLGSMCGLGTAGVLVRHLGTRRVALVGMGLLLAGTGGMAAGVALGAMGIVALGLTLFGLGMGACEIAINIDGAEVERRSGRPLMHALHGCFSFGTVCGSLLSFALIHAGLPVAWHLGAAAAISVLPIAWVARWMPGGIATGPGGPPHPEGAPPPGRDPYLRDLRLYLIGLVVLAMALAEGAANDWLALLMVDEHGFAATSGSLIYLVFAATMTLGRFGGGHFLRRYGPGAVMRATALLCALGLAGVVFLPQANLAAAAVLLWGLGTSLGFPIAISAAGASGRDTVGRVRTVTICGYVAFLVGPPFLGLMGDAFGLRAAMAVVLVLVVLAALVARAVQPPRRADPVEPAPSCGTC